MNDDEIKNLQFSGEAYRLAQIFRPSLSVSVMWTVLFYRPMLFLTDSVLWTMRIVPVIMGTLAIPASFAAARAMKFSILPSLVAAGCVASMPWAIFWSRQQWAGGIVLFQALLLAGLARIIWQGGGWISVLVATMGLFGILYDYPGGWAMIGMPILAALLARGYAQRVKALVVFGVALILWIPWLLEAKGWMSNVTTKSITEGTGILSVAFVPVFFKAVYRTLRTFVFPEGSIYWTSLQGVAMHPVAVLVAAVLGVFSAGFRVGAFLLLGFFGATISAIMSSNSGASGHRMITAYLFIALATGAFFQFLAKRFAGAGQRRFLSVVAAAFLLLVSAQSMRIFLSPEFWHGSSGVFSYGATKVSEAIKLPAQRPTVVDFELSRMLGARLVPDPRISVFSYENWMPNTAGDYAFSPPVSVIYPLYQRALVADKLQAYGEGQSLAFIASFDQADVERWRNFGWSADIICGTRSLLKTQIPSLIFGGGIRWSWDCREEQSIVYRGRWLGGQGELSLWYGGLADLEFRNETSGVGNRVSGNQGWLNIPVATRDELTITLRIKSGAPIRLLEGKDGAGELVGLEKFEPLTAR
ncbi:MAG: hypothetical protein ACK5Y6_08320 [Pseudomonadota bacterium]